MKKRGLLIFILAVLFFGFILNSEISADGHSSKGKKLPGFDLKIPERDISPMRSFSQFNAGIEEEHKVIVILKEPSSIREWKNQVSTFGQKEIERVKFSMREYVINTEANKENVKHRYNSFNGFSTTLSTSELNYLKTNPLVDLVELDREVHAFLQDSVPLINASSAWNLQVDGINLTGEGETVCVIDTGVDYTHPDLGGCVPEDVGTRLIESYSLTSPNYPLEYPRNPIFSRTIIKRGYGRISIFFSEIDVEDDLDRVCIANKYNELVACYTGKESNIWSPSVEGDTIKLVLFSEGTGEGGPYRGFNVSAVKNATTDSTLNWSSCLKVIGGHNFVDSDSDPRDYGGHGTHCAGIVGANGSITGVAPGANIVAVKTLDGPKGEGYFSDVIAGIEWCISNKEKYNISVISMSLGVKNKYFQGYCDEYDDQTTKIIDEATSKNISVVISSGNGHNHEKIFFPACIKNAIPVTSSVKADNGLSNFANRWDNPLLKILAAPGGSSTGGSSDINSTFPGNSFQSLSGTSMSAPHVAGAIAIINQYLRLNNMTKTPSEIKDILIASGKKIYDSQSGRNFSRVDVYSALRSLCEDDLQNTTWERKELVGECRENNTGMYNGTIIQYDKNNCGFVENTTFYEIQEGSCEYCTPNWSAVFNEEENFTWFNDTNDCYNKTELDMHLEGRPLNYSLNVTENQTTILDDDNKTILELNFNITNSSENSSVIRVKKEKNESNKNWVIVGGLDLSSNESFSKTIYFDKRLDNTIICIADKEVESIESVSEYCNGTNETKLTSCSTSEGKYNCSISDDGRWKISGLKNSAIKEVAFCGDGVCNGEESCASCPSDCGKCITGSGGGGSSRTFVKTEEIKPSGEESEPEREEEKNIGINSLSDDSSEKDIPVDESEEEVENFKETIGMLLIVALISIVVVLIAFKKVISFART